REELARERADRQLDPELAGVRTRRDHEDISLEVARIGVLAYVDAELRRPANDLSRECRRIGNAVGGAEDRTEHVVDVEAGDEPRGDPLDRHAELRLQLAARLELGETLGCRREEDVAHLLKPRRAELLEERDRLA